MTLKQVGNGVSGIGWVATRRVLLPPRLYQERVVYHHNNNPPPPQGRHIADYATFNAFFIKWRKHLNESEQTYYIPSKYLNCDDHHCPIEVSLHPIDNCPSAEPPPPLFDSVPASFTAAELAEGEKMGPPSITHMTYQKYFDLPHVTAGDVMDAVSAAIKVIEERNAKFRDHSENAVDA